MYTFLSVSAVYNVNIEVICGKILYLVFLTRRKFPLPVVFGGMLAW